jgi:hypothetical protein
MGLGEVAVAVDRVGGEVEAERFLLGRHALRQRPGRGDRASGSARHCFRRRRTDRPARFARVGGAGGMGEDRLGGSEHAARLGAIPSKARRRRKALELAAVEQARIDPFGEIVERLEAAVRAAVLDQLLHRLFTYALKRAQCVTDCRDPSL